jgi:hypothetical protein
MPPRSGRPLRRKLNRESGSAVALALMLLLVLALALAVLSEGVVARMREEQREMQSVRLAASCDAALAESLAGLAASPGFPGVSARPFAGGKIESEVKSAGTGRVVRARATLGDRVREIEAEIQFASGRPWVVKWRRVR